MTDVKSQVYGFPKLEFSYIISLAFSFVNSSRFWVIMGYVSIKEVGNCFTLSWANKIKDKKPKLYQYLLDILFRFVIESWNKLLEVTNFVTKKREKTLRSYVSTHCCVLLFNGYAVPQFTAVFGCTLCICRKIDNNRAYLLRFGFRGFKIPFDRKSGIVIALSNCTILIN